MKMKHQMEQGVMVNGSIRQALKPPCLETVMFPGLDRTGRTSHLLVDAASRDGLVDSVGEALTGAAQRDVSRRHSRRLEDLVLGGTL
jgi:hypothetical protein